MGALVAIDDKISQTYTIRAIDAVFVLANKFPEHPDVILFAPLIEPHGGSMIFAWYNLRQKFGDAGREQITKESEVFRRVMESTLQAIRCVDLYDGGYVPPKTKITRSE